MELLCLHSTWFSLGGVPVSKCSVKSNRLCGSILMHIENHYPINLIGVIYVQSYPVLLLWWTWYCESVIVH